MNRSLASLALVVLLAAGGCGGDTEDDPTLADPSADVSSSPPRSSTAASASADGPILKAADFSFSPRTITVRSGQVLKITNTGRVAHTWTAKPGQALTFDVALAEPGDEEEFTPTKVGSFTFLCKIHESRGMTGTLVVTA
jgi:plastocyanin